MSLEERMSHWHFSLQKGPNSGFKLLSEEASSSFFPLDSQDVHCRYKVFLDTADNETDKMGGSVSLEFRHRKYFNYKVATSQVNISTYLTFTLWISFNTLTFLQHWQIYCLTFQFFVQTIWMCMYHVVTDIFIPTYAQLLGFCVVEGFKSYWRNVN